MTAERKRDAREKFLLGGLVVKAGLSKADRAFLLGGLIELARLMPGSPEHRRLRDLGEEAFKAFRPNDPPARIEEMAEWP
ncbi:conjugal transfer protein TraD [Rhizobium sp. H4]|uniref:conjugal transfer protein TraD n=1 Tax=Rhizobium sp. H4 TaxID=2035449 RepID=UPI000BE7F1D9|nr:conjugal transfer protein TraD [Rhizobium sp. H4]PDV86124.1 conjugal transfer protein TraD [Rhizobium sp. H4]